jgi:hypothetical protein
LRTIQIAFVAAVLMIAAYWLYMVSDYIVLWSRRVMYLAGMGVRVCGALVVFLVLVAAVYWLARQQYERNRMRDGAHERRVIYLHPWHVRVFLWMIGRVPPRVELFPESLIAPGVVVSSAGVAEIEPRAGWDRQLTYAQTVEKTNRIRAAAPGDGVAALPWFAGGGKTAAGLGRMLAGGERPPRPVTVDAPPPLPQLPPPAPLTPQAAIAASRPASLVLGQTDSGELMRWDMAQTPHFRVHGTTQGAGKTNAAQVLAAAALRTGAHVVVFDPAGLKDWQDFAGHAELVDASDPATLADGAARLLTIYHNRTRQLVEAGARNIGEMARPPQRIVVVLCEFGAQCEQARADGVMGDIETPLLQLARKAAAAGIHLVLEDQAIVRWPRALSANVAGVAIGRMPLYSAQACGFVPRRGATTETLQPGQFWFGGQLVNVPHMQPALRELLADVPAPRLRVMNTPRWEGAGNVSQSVRGGVFPEVETSETAETPTPQVETNTGNAPDAGKWYDYILSYMGRPEGADLWKQPAKGVRELARAMSVLETGNEANEDNYVSIVSKAAKQIRNSARLPNGDRLGTDITGGA